MFALDPLYFVFALPPLALALWAQWRVRRAFGQWSEQPNLAGLTGAEVAVRLLARLGLPGVKVEPVGGELSDHYDPRDRTVRLSEGVYGRPTIAALAIAAHELGHAQQDAAGDAVLRLRGALVGPVTFGSGLAPFVFLAGLLFQAPALAWLGVAAFSFAVLFALVTLPVEFDASRRALRLLEASGYLTPTEQPGAKAVLDAAALTYVAGALSAISTLLYYVLQATGLTQAEAEG